MLLLYDILNFYFSSFDRSEGPVVDTISRDLFEYIFGQICTNILDIHHTCLLHYFIVLKCLHGHM